MEKKIGIVNSSSFGEHFPRFKEKLSRLGKVENVKVNPKIRGKELAKKLQEFNYIIASVTPDYNREFFKNISQDIRLIARHGVGVDNIDITSASEKNIMVTKVSSEHEKNSVAELTLGLMLICSRKLYSAINSVNNNMWERRAQFIGNELSRMNIGIIGFGNIGRQVYHILSNGFTANLMTYDPYINKNKIPKDIEYIETLKSILTSCDLISIHASMNEESYNLLDKKEFEMMKNNAIIINTARGEIIKEEALICALEKNEIGAAGLDVCKNEPISKNNPLLGYENVHISPHIGGYSEYSLRCMDKKVVEDVETVINGDRPNNLVNKDLLME